jgi:hypothetical protein
MDALGGGWGRRSLAEMAAFHEVNNHRRPRKFTI